MQLSLFAATDAHVIAFMERFKALRFGRPDSWCHCQCCELARLVQGVADGTVSPALFKPWYDHFTNTDVCYAPRGKPIDVWQELAVLGWEFSQESQL